jgi:hypothetical protein
MDVASVDEGKHYLFVVESGLGIVLSNAVYEAFSKVVVIFVTRFVYFSQLEQVSDFVL